MAAIATFPPRQSAERREGHRAALRSLGFEVSLKVDLDLAAMQRAVADSPWPRRGADLSLFYYGGHGLQLAGTTISYRSTPCCAARDIGTRTVALDTVIAGSAKGDGRPLVFLDACRNNPFSAVASTAPGLARVGKAADFMIAFATQPDAVAFDGAAATARSPGAARHLTSPGVDLSNMMIAVRPT